MKTTVFGLLAACGAAVVILPGLPCWLETTARVCVAVGTAGLGFFARDNKTTDEDAGAKPKDK